MQLKQITDKDLIVFLVGKGFEIIRTKKEKGRNRSLVFFKNSVELEKAILCYVNKSDPKFNEFQEADKRVTTLFHV